MPDPALVQDRLVDQAEHRPAPTRQRDQRAEQRPAGDERLGAVDRVEHPDELGVGPHGPVLLAQDAVLRVGRLDQLAHPRLGLAVGDGHRARRRPWSRPTTGVRK